MFWLIPTLGLILMGNTASHGLVIVCVVHGRNAKGHRSIPIAMSHCEVPHTNYIHTYQDICVHYGFHINSQDWVRNHALRKMKRNRVHIRLSRPVTSVNRPLHARRFQPYSLTTF